MSNMIRWNPVSEFEDLIDRYNRYFGFTRPEHGSRADSADSRVALRRSDWAPVVDIRESDSAFLIEAELAGLRREDVKVSVHEGVLTIEGERNRQAESDEGKAHRIERVYGSFLRRFSLPENVDADSIQAKFRDGILSITLAKAEPVQPKAIEVSID
mgnify:CR=1 FL=1